MIINVRFNGVELKNIDSIPSHVQMQLNHLGFEDAGPRTLIVTSSPKELLPKLIKSLDKESVKYILSAKASNVLADIDAERNLLDRAMKYGSQFKDGKYDKKDFKEFSHFLELHIPRKLKDHQIKAAYHFYKVKNGANFSVPGSGKTTVVLSVFEKLRAEGKVSTLFIVGPPSCFGSWKNEFLQVFGRKPKIVTFAGGNIHQRKKSYYSGKNVRDMYLTTFQTLLNDSDEVNILFKLLDHKVLLVIDEAHYIKQIEGKWAQAVLKVAKNAEARSILTGTPIPRSYLDLFNMFEFLWPGQESLSAVEKFKLENYEKGKNYEEAASLLNPKLGPLFYRVRKKDLKLQPQFINEPIKVKMQKNERRIYSLISKKIEELSAKDYAINAETLKELKKGRIIRLRQALSYPKLLITGTGISNYKEALIEDFDIKYLISHYDELEIPGKLIELLNILEKHRERKEKVIIWSNFLGTIDLISNQLSRNGYKSKMIVGAVPVEKENIIQEETREKIIEKFLNESSGLDILIANPAACAESISLHTTCHHAVYYDLSHNCAQYLQSLDRIHRVGASEKIPAHYDFLQYSATIENKILQSLKSKAKKMSDLIDGDYNIYSLDMFAGEDEDAEVYDKIFSK